MKNVITMALFMVLTGAALAELPENPPAQVANCNTSASKESTKSALSEINYCWVYDSGDRLLGEGSSGYMKRRWFLKTDTATRNKFIGEGICTQWTGKPSDEWTVKITHNGSNDQYLQFVADKYNIEHAKESGKTIHLFLNSACEIFALTAK